MDNTKYVEDIFKTFMDSVAKLDNLDISKLDFPEYIKQIMYVLKHDAKYHEAMKNFIDKNKQLSSQYYLDISKSGKDIAKLNVNFIVEYSMNKCELYTNLLSIQRDNLAKLTTKDVIDN